MSRGLSPPLWVPLPSPAQGPQLEEGGEAEGPLTWTAWAPQREPLHRRGHSAQGRIWYRRT